MIYRGLASINIHIIQSKPFYSQYNQFYTNPINFMIIAESTTTKGYAQDFINVKNSYTIYFVIKHTSVKATSRLTHDLNKRN